MKTDSSVRRSEGPTGTGAGSIPEENTEHFSCCSGSFDGASGYRTCQEEPVTTESVLQRTSEPDPDP